MTGFGRGLAASEHKKFTVEIKSLNSKQLDFAMRAPGFLKEVEVETRNRVAERLERGKVDLSASVESVGSETPSTVNVELLKNYKAQLEGLGKALGLPEPQDWYTLLMRMPEAMHTEAPEADDADRKAYFEALDAALGELNAFRRREGARLYRFFCEKIANIRSLLAEVDPYEASRVPKIRARLEEQLQHLDSIDYDKGRLEQELIFYIEKLDVSEEKLRLRTHLDYFLEVLGPESGERTCSAVGCGKKLGFVAQEMGREINTLGSKSNNAEMQKIVVGMKDELEQIKEQVLNVL